MRRFARKCFLPEVEPFIKCSCSDGLHSLQVVDVSMRPESLSPFRFCIEIPSSSFESEAASMMRGFAADAGQADHRTAQAGPSGQQYSKQISPTSTFGGALYGENGELRSQGFAIEDDHDDDALDDPEALLASFAHGDEFHRARAKAKSQVRPSLARAGAGRPTVGAREADYGPVVLCSP